MIKQFILNYNIIQVYNSEGTNTGPKGYPEYKSNTENTLFWGMYRKKDIDLCLKHKGKIFIYWHFNDCNPNYKHRRNNVDKIIRLKNITHLCNNESARFLDFYNITYQIIIFSWLTHVEDVITPKYISIYTEIYDNYRNRFFINSEKKLIYKLIIKQDISIKIIKKKKSYNFTCINKNFKYKGKYYGNNNIFFIFLNLKKKIYEIYLDKHFVCNINSYDDILLYGKKENLSINYPLCMDNTNIETNINFMYLLDNLYDDIAQINILNITKSLNDNKIDNEIINKNVNYLCIYNYYDKFNLGFTRNLYKYLNLSTYIMMADIDILINKDDIIKMIKQLDDYDIICPYKNRLYYSSINEKYDFFISNIMNFNILKNNPKTISGGIVLFKNSIFEELGGYDEINNYGYEDRNLDVSIIYNKYKIKYNNYKVVHLYHPSYKNEICQELRKYTRFFYNCFYQKNLTKHDSIHLLCKHNHKYINILTRQKYNLNAKIIKPKYTKKDDILFKFNGKPNIIKSTNLYNNNIVLIHGNSIDKYYIIKSNNINIRINDNISLIHVLTNKFLNKNGKLVNNIKYFKLQNKNIIKINNKLVHIKYFCQQKQLMNIIIKKYKSSNSFINLVQNKKIIFINDDLKNIHNFDILVSTNVKFLKKKTNKICILYCKPEDFSSEYISKHYYIRLLYPIITTNEYTTFNNIGTIKDYLLINDNSKLSYVNKDNYIVLEDYYNKRPPIEDIIIYDLLKNNIKEIYINSNINLQLNNNRIKYI